MLDLFQILDSLAREQYMDLQMQIRMFMNILFRYSPKRIEDRRLDKRREICYSGVEQRGAPGARGKKEDNER